MKDVTKILEDTLSACINRQAWWCGSPDMLKPQAEQEDFKGKNLSWIQLLKFFELHFMKSNMYLSSIAVVIPSHRLMREAVTTQTQNLLRWSWFAVKWPCIILKRVFFLTTAPMKQMENRNQEFLNKSIKPIFWVNLKKFPWHLVLACVADQKLFVPYSTAINSICSDLRKKSLQEHLLHASFWVHQHCNLQHKCCRFCYKNVPINTEEGV